MLDPVAIRAQTLASLSTLGLADVPCPPPLEPGLRTIRSPAEVRDRLACTAAIVVLAIRALPRKDVRAWVEGEGLGDALGPAERTLLREADRDLASRLSFRVEALWALAWATGLAPALDPAETCSDQLASWMPDVRVAGSARAFPERPLRPDAELAAAWDLHRCLDAVVRARGLYLSPLLSGGRLQGLGAINRRLALEWLFLPGPWERPYAEPARDP